MRVKITIIKDNGEEMEISRKMNALDSRNVLSSVEQAVQDLQNEIVPLISESMIEEHQSDFVGEKNQEEKRE